MSETHELLQQLHARWAAELNAFIERTAEAADESNPPDLAIEDYLREVSTLRDALGEGLEDLLLEAAEIGLSTRAISRASGIAAPTIQKRINASLPELAAQRRRMRGAGRTR